MRPLPPRRDEQVFLPTAPVQAAAQTVVVVVVVVAVVAVVVVAVVVAVAVVAVVEVVVVVMVAVVVPRVVPQPPPARHVRLCPRPLRLAWAHHARQACGLRPPGAHEKRANAAHRQ
ncbi:MAG: hypothetical protein ACKVQQ_06195 [Burkholderiales bacterium]